MMTCYTFADLLTPFHSAVWKQRFLALYDYPKVLQHEDFAIAYRIRRMTLCEFANFKNGKDDQIRYQLEVIRDMIVGEFDRCCC
jgi:hypothetical protein